MSQSTLKGKNVKPTYFDTAGRALTIRYALAIGGIVFEDARVNFQQWPTMKATTPYGQLPTLEVRFLYGHCVFVY